MSRAGLPVFLAVGVAVLAISSSAPLIAYAAAPGLAIAFWRNALGVAVVGPVGAVRGRAHLRDLWTTQRRTAVVCVLAGLALAVHFAAWIPSAKLTSVATSTALVCTTPIWSAIIATVQSAGRRRRGGRSTRPPVVVWVGIGFAVLGAVLATGADLTVSTTAVIGDLLALAGGIACAVYMALGERAREVLSTTAYTTVCYGVCALALLATCLATGTRLGGYPTSAWLAIAGMTLGPQLLGHTLLNYSVRHIPPTTLNVITLLEVPGAALLGWLLLDQLPGAASVPGLAVLTAGVLVVLVGAARSARLAARIRAISDAAQPVP